MFHARVTGIASPRQLSVGRVELCHVRCFDCSVHGFDLIGEDRCDRGVDTDIAVGGNGAPDTGQRGAQFVRFERCQRPVLRLPAK